MIAITTSSSTSVKARFLAVRFIRLLINKLPQPQGLDKSKTKVIEGDYISQYL